MAYADQFALRRSQIFRDKVGQALLVYARNLKTATPAKGQTGIVASAAVVPDGKTCTWTREQELAWARAIISPLIDRWIDLAVIHVITNDSIANAGEDAKDADVLWMVTQIMPDLLSQEVR